MLVAWLSPLIIAAREPILPPLRKVFAVIEAQRDEELERGELPLEEALARVQLPQEIVPPPAINELLPGGPQQPLLLASDHSPGMRVMDLSGSGGMVRRDSIGSRNSYGEHCASTLLTCWGWLP